jgi:hypothetical protein
MKVTDSLLDPRPPQKRHRERKRKQHEPHREEAQYSCPGRQKTPVVRLLLVEDIAQKHEKLLVVCGGHAGVIAGEVQHDVESGPYQDGECEELHMRRNLW